MHYYKKILPKFSIPFCSKFYPLSKNLRAFIMILAVEGPTAPASWPHVRHWQLKG